MTEESSNPQKSTRSQIVRLLYEHPEGLSGKQILEALIAQGTEVKQPTVSGQVDFLKRSGSVTVVKSGRESIASLTAEYRNALLPELLGSTEVKPVQKSDWRKRTSASKRKNAHQQNNDEPPKITHLSTIFPGVNSDHKLLFISPTEPTSEELEWMGGAAKLTVEHHDKIPKTHDASIVVIDGRGKKDSQVDRLIAAAQNIKKITPESDSQAEEMSSQGYTRIKKIEAPSSIKLLSEAEEIPVFVIGDASPKSYIAKGASRGFKPDEMWMIGNNAIAVIAQQGRSLM